MQNSTTNVRKLTGTAMLGAVAAVLMYLEFPIPIMPSFVKLDVSELPALLAAYAYGPLSGIAVCLIKNLIKLPSTSTAAVGELFNFAMGALFVGGLCLQAQQDPPKCPHRRRDGRTGYGRRQRTVQLFHRLPGLCGYVPPAAGGYHRDVPGYQS